MKSDPPHHLRTRRDERDRCPGGAVGELGPDVPDQAEVLVHQAGERDREHRDADADEGAAGAGFVGCVRTGIHFNLPFGCGCPHEDRKPKTTLVPPEGFEPP